MSSFRFKKSMVENSLEQLYSLLLRNFPLSIITFIMISHWEPRLSACILYALHFFYSKSKIVFRQTKFQLVNCDLPVDFLYSLFCMFDSTFTCNRFFGGYVFDSCKLVITCSNHMSKLLTGERPNFILKQKKAVYLFILVWLFYTFIGISVKKNIKYVFLLKMVFVAVFP